MGNSLSENGQVGGTAGVLLSIMFLVSGIVYISTRKQEKLGGDIACAIMLAIAALLGFATPASSLT
ncbi:hypothetical protein [Lacticaseibacillus saniviri]|uniref:hypothetical protein n=1 Tax=Lacticaseibacillus saniviri TaxID=931533 RepID=UPI001CDB23FD|nr:hypothetical protein [Lacticaseibacillus saniviri]